MSRAIRCIAVVSAALLAAPAHAHQAEGLAGGFVAGFVHPFGGVDHLLAMVSVGLWGAILGRPLVTLLPVVFPLVMTVGGIVGIAGVPLPAIELGIALSVLALGAAIAAAWRAPIWLACALVAFFAIFHGYAHGTELPSIADPVAYSAGFVIATGLLHLTGITLGSIRSRTSGLVVLRMVGTLIAASGGWFLAAALA